MLIKRKNFMSSKTLTVKKLCAMTLVGFTVAMAPAAHADDLPWTDKVVSVKFKLSELKSENGTQKVYEKLRKRATSFCKSDATSLYMLGQSTSECRADLMKQFVKNANIDALKTYHSSKTSQVHQPNK